MLSMKHAYILYAATYPFGAALIWLALIRLTNDKPGSIPPLMIHRKRKIAALALVWPGIPLLVVFYVLGQLLFLTIRRE
jgi:hypothetical protein